MLDERPSLSALLLYSKSHRLYYAVPGSLPFISYVKGVIASAEELFSIQEDSQLFFFCCTGKICTGSFYSARCCT